MYVVGHPFIFLNKHSMQNKNKAKCQTQNEGRIQVPNSQPLFFLLLYKLVITKDPFLIDVFQEHKF